jgi:YD repeat-containing protein
MIDPNFDPSAIPLGHTYDDNGDVLSYRDEFGFWYVYRRDDDGRILTYRASSRFAYDYTYDDGKHTITHTRTQEAA